MGPPKLGLPQIWEFRDSHLRVLGQNDIWMLVSLLGIEYTIRGKVVASPKSGCGESCEYVVAHGSSMHQSVSITH
jgi:hypothetical protein